MTDTPALCPGCGATWREGARFCGRCGRTQDGTAPARETLASVGPRGLAPALTLYFVALGSLVVLWLADAGTVGAIYTYAGLGLVGLAGVAWVGPESWGLFRPPSLTLRGTAMALVVLAFIAALVYALVALFPSMYMDETAEFREEGRGLAYALFATAICPAVVEELLFRGVILTGLRGVFPTRTAVVVSGLMFSTLHVSVLSFVSHALLGILFGAACVRTRSLWPSMVLHGGWNAGVVLLHW